MQQNASQAAPPADPSPELAIRRRARRRWAAGAALLLALAMAPVAWWATRGPAAVSYTTAPITRGAVTQTVTATGTVNPVLTIIVGSYISGVIQQLFCDYNTQVRKGQICAKIDPRPYQSVVDQNKANLDIALAQLDKDKATLAYTKLTTDRNASLAARSYTSQDAADSARSLYEQAQAQIALDQATIELRQALLDAAKVNLGYTDIVSPVDGTVVSRNVTMGQTVAATFQTPTLFLIATDLTRMQVDTNVSESDIGAVKEGGRAMFTVDAYPGRVFAGKVVQVRQSPQTVQNVVTYDVVVGVANADLALKPGMTASTQIVIDERTDVVRVPDQALRYAPGGVAAAGPAAANGTQAQARLWLLRNGRAVAVPVVLGLDDDRYTELVSGEVKPGDQAIMSEQRGAASGTRAALPSPRL
ncbi:MAG: efflux transporter periplasmic adaptor subunit [Rhodospirillales bacterium 70-18]|nr:efflux RND transporter periplasmic adaptor subunit [Rhodospirillales bacterium]OJY74591.1 MAG: efflux transporter periplasmic adaptor subunit [Rhodospirillales bacterium 70-18]